MFNEEYNENQEFIEGELDLKYKNVYSIRQTTNLGTNIDTYNLKYIHTRKDRYSFV